MLSLEILTAGDLFAKNGRLPFNPFSTILLTFPITLVHRLSNLNLPHPLENIYRMSHAKLFFSGNLYIFCNFITGINIVSWKVSFFEKHRKIMPTLAIFIYWTNERSESQKCSSILTLMFLWLIFSFSFLFLFFLGIYDLTSSDFTFQLLWRFMKLRNIFAFDEK